MQCISTNMLCIRTTQHTCMFALCHPDIMLKLMEPLQVDVAYIDILAGMGCSPAADCKDYRRQPTCNAAHVSLRMLRWDRETVQTLVFASALACIQQPDQRQTAYDMWMLTMCQQPCRWFRPAPVAMDAWASITRAEFCCASTR